MNNETTTQASAPDRKPNRRERRMVRHWRIKTPNKNQPMTSECACGLAFAAYKTRDAIRARQEHERKAHGKGRAP